MAAKTEPAVLFGSTSDAPLGDHPKAAIDNHFKTGHREPA
jgi:hypothetical protein